MANSVSQRQASSRNTNVGRRCTRHRFSFSFRNFYCGQDSYRADNALFEGGSNGFRGNMLGMGLGDVFAVGRGI